MVILYVRSIYGSAETVKLTIANPVGKELLGKVAYETAQRNKPMVWWKDWDRLTDDWRELFIQIAVSVRGFHPDA